MKYLFAFFTLILAASLSGCDMSTPCQAHDAYTIPAHWTHGYYSTEQHQNFWTGKWYTVRVYHEPQYDPTQYVPAVRCKASK